MGWRRDFMIGVASSTTATLVWWLLFGGAAAVLSIVVNFLLGWKISGVWIPLWFLIAAAALWFGLYKLGKRWWSHGMFLAFMVDSPPAVLTYEEHALLGESRGTPEQWLQINRKLKASKLLPNRWYRVGLVTMQASILTGAAFLIAAIVGIAANIVGWVS